MIKRSFFGISAPRLNYEVIEEAPAEPVSIQPGSRVTLLMDAPLEKAGDALLKSGDAVLKGQRLQLFENVRSPYAVSPVAGKIISVAPFIGMMEKPMTAVVIEADPGAETGRDAAFKEAASSVGLAEAEKYFQCLPGKPDFSPFVSGDKTVKTIAVLGTETDLLAVTRQYVVGSAMASVKSGIDMLRKITGIQNIILVAYQHMVQVAGSAGAGVRSVDIRYPAGSAQMVWNVLSPEQGREGEVAFFSVEAVAAIGAASQTGELPLEKLLTVVKKDGTRQLVKAPVGTHVGDVLEAVRQGAESMDRVVLGGPMTGHAVYALDQPITADVDILMIQDQADIPDITDTPCTNCGECVRVCPVNVPVNQMIRYLDAGEYEQAAENADLFSCIECGLCAYVCESHIPILQFVALAKRAVQRLKAAEEENA